MSPRTSRGLKVLLGVGGAVVLGVLAVGLWFAAMMSGGFDDLFDWRQPTESSASVVRARERAVPQVTAQGRQLAASLASASGTQVSQVEGDAVWCDEGQHNFKIDDDYDLLCSAEHAVLLTGPAEQARSQVVALLASLEEQGFRPPYESGRLDVTPLVEGRLVDADIVRGSGRYARDGKSEVRVELLATDSPRYRLLTAPRRLQLRLDGRPLPLEADPADLLPAGGYGVWLTLTVTYFRS